MRLVKLEMLPPGGDIYINPAMVESVSTHKAFEAGSWVTQGEGADVHFLGEGYIYVVTTPEYTADLLMGVSSE